MFSYLIYLRYHVIDSNLPTDSFAKNFRDFGTSYNNRPLDGVEILQRQQSSEILNEPSMVHSYGWIM